MDIHFNNVNNDTIRRNPVIKAIFLGDEDVGKSNLIRIYSGYEFDRLIYPTICTDKYDNRIKFEDKDYKIIIYDTPGRERFRNMIKYLFRNINIVILVFDMTRKKSFLKLDNFLELIRENYSDFNKLTFLLIGNKADLSDEWEIKENVAKKFAEIIKSKFFISSAKNVPEQFKMFLDEFFKEYIKVYKPELENQPIRPIIHNLNNRNNRRRRTTCV